MPSPAPFVVPDLSFPAYVLAEAEARGDHPALVDAPTGRTISYAELAALVRCTAAGLAAHGFAKADVLAIFSPNVPEFAVATHAALSLGVVVTTVNPLYTVDELAAQLRDARARAILTVAPLLPVAAAAAERAGVTRLYVFGEPPSGAAALPFASLLEHGDAPPEVAIDPARDLAFLPYSSGTTGLPKGVMLTHRNVVANVAQLFAHAPELLSPRTRLIGVLPFFHIYGLVPVLNGALHAGATLVVMPRFELDAFLGAIERHRITGLHVVPPIVLALAKHPAVERYDLSSLQWINSGAAPLDASLTRAAATRLRCVVRQGYGLTESSPATHFLTEREAETHAGTVGRPVPGTEVRIADVATGAPLPPGMEGEVWVRGPQVMLGYLGRPDATAAMLTADGWLRTGDVGIEDADGFLRVVDRVKELIKFKGMQVAPAELEALLLEHPSVADAAVIPHPDAEAGEVPAAYVVPRAGVASDDALAQALMAHLAGRVAPHKRVRVVCFLEQIPKSPSGKILRRVLVEQARARLAAERAPAAAV